MLIPEGLKYTKEHEWIQVDGEVGIVGITDYAQNELSDIVFVELPEVGQKVAKGERVATLEAVKTVADVYSPVTGEVIEVNERLTDEPDLINRDPYGDGWIVKIKIENPDELNDLLSAEEYEKLVEEEEA